MVFSFLEHLMMTPLEREEEYQIYSSLSLSPMHSCYLLRFFFYSKKINRKKLEHLRQSLLVTSVVIYAYYR